MKIKCPYCETMFDDTLINCPNCGAASEGVRRTASRQPITIEQLQKWYQDRGLPPYHTTRFFIGVDYRKPRAFGIYKDEATGNFVVYKNLASGERKVRYEGTDEAYAVNEIYMRLKQEIIQQKKNSGGKGGKGKAAGAGKNNGGDKKQSGVKAWFSNHKKKLIITLAVLMGIVLLFVCVDATPSKGYYQYNGTNYYHAATTQDTDDWYYFDDDTHQWEHTYDALPEELTDGSTSQDFYDTSTWDPTTQEGDFDGPLLPFTVSEYAEQYENSTGTTTDTWDNDDDDTDYDWDTGTDTWDNTTTDWDTDW